MHPQSSVHSDGPIEYFREDDGIADVLWISQHAADFFGWMERDSFVPDRRVGSLRLAIDLFFLQPAKIVVEHVVQALFDPFIRLSYRFSQPARVFGNGMRFDVFPDVLRYRLSQRSALDWLGQGVRFLRQRLRLDAARRVPASLLGLASSASGRQGLSSRWALCRNWCGLARRRLRGGGSIGCSRLSVTLPCPAEKLLDFVFECLPSLPCLRLSDGWLAGSSLLGLWRPAASRALATRLLTVRAIPHDGIQDGSQHENEKPDDPNPVVQIANEKRKVHQHSVRVLV